MCDYEEAGAPKTSFLSCDYVEACAFLSCDYVEACAPDATFCPKKSGHTADFLQKRSHTVAFSKVAVIRLINGSLHLLFRIGNMRKSHIIEPHLRAVLVDHQVTLISVARGRCYDHNFMRFLTIFGEKIGVFLKNQCYDQNFA
jgi:hypothetical protein